jgi:hypothetical protein
MNWEFLKGILLFAVIGPPLAVYLAQGHGHHAPVSRVRDARTTELPRGDVLHFYRLTCPASMKMEARVVKLRTRGYSIRSINIQRDPATAKAHAIDATPTLIYTVDGREVHRFRGGMSEASLERFCRGEHISGSW